jgi:hypothetical protein
VGTDSAAAIICPLLLALGWSLGAQSRSELLIDVAVVQVDSETTHCRPFTYSCLSDPTTKLLTRTQLRVFDGATAKIKIGNPVPYAAWDDACGNPLTSVQRRLTVTPEVHSAERVTLHVVLDATKTNDGTNPACSTQPISTNVFDVRLRDGEIRILGGLNSEIGNSASQRLMIAIIPEIMQTPVVTR